MKMKLLRDGLIITPETEMEREHMTFCVEGIIEDLTKIDKEGNIQIRFKMRYEASPNI